MPISLGSGSADSRVAVLAPGGWPPPEASAVAQPIGLPIAPSASLVWLGREVAAGEAKELVKSCPKELGRTTLHGGFRERHALGQALASATTLGLGNQAADSSPQQVADVLLLNGQGKILSMEALSAIARVERRKCSSLVLRCDGSPSGHIPALGGSRGGVASPCSWHRVPAWGDKGAHSEGNRGEAEDCPDKA